MSRSADIEQYKSTLIQKRPTSFPAVGLLTHVCGLVRVLSGKSALFFSQISQVAVSHQFFALFIPETEGE